VKVGLIPQCAMKVTRSTDGGDLSPYTPPAPCGCYYASQVPVGKAAPTGCAACTTSAECSDGGGTCNHGFCEPDQMPTLPIPADGGACFSGTPTTNADLVNACTGAASIVKSVTLPAADGGLEPLP
jgi:hypothetical protein